MFLNTVVCINGVVIIIDRTENLKKLANKIEELKEQLNGLLKVNDKLIDQEIIELSEQLDIYILYYIRESEKTVGGLINEEHRI